MERFLTLTNGVIMTFVPLFVATDAIGNLPFLLTLTQDMDESERPRIVRQAMITALGIGLGFIALGKTVFWLLGIAVADFLIAGGLVLLVLAATELAFRGKEEKQPAGEEMAGVVPIGTPLVVGPAVLTTLLLLIGQYPYPIVIFSFIANLAFTWLVFCQANGVASFLGSGGLKAMSKIASLLLAAIAVKMIRQGVIEILNL